MGIVEDWLIFLSLVGYCLKAVRYNDLEKARLSKLSNDGFIGFFCSAVKKDVPEKDICLFPFTGLSPYKFFRRKNDYG